MDSGEGTCRRKFEEWSLKRGFWRVRVLRKNLEKESGAGIWRRNLEKEAGEGIWRVGVEINASELSNQRYIIRKRKLPN